MHLGTIVKIKARNEKEALDKVRDLVTDNGEYGAYNSGSSGFDYCDESAIQIAKNDNNTPFTEEDFKTSRKQELEQSKDFRERAAHERDECMKGYYLQKAGECLQSDKFWSAERQVFDYSDWGDTGERNIFYVRTNRHY
jgi:hypothetical protein